MEATPNVDGIEVLAPISKEFSEILTPEALQFVGHLAREFEDRRQSLLERRRTVQAEIDSGKLPDFLPDRYGKVNGKSLRYQTTCRTVG